MKIENKNIILLFLLLFGAAIRFFIITILHIEPISDFSSYMNMAISMIETGHMDDGMGNIAHYSSGYPIFLIPFFTIFGSSPETAQFTNAILGIVSILLVYICAKEVLPSWKWAMIPALIWSTYPPAIVYTEYVAKENLMIPLLLVQTLILLKIKYSYNQILLSILFGVIFGFELLVGPAIIFTGVLIGFALIQFPLRIFTLSKFPWKPILASAFACVLVLTPWLFYTTVELGQPVLNTNGGFNLYLGNNPNAKISFIGIQNTPMGPKWHALREREGEVRASASLRDMALNYIFKNPGKTILLSMQKVLYFWIPPFHKGKWGNKSKTEELARLYWAVYYIIIIIFSIVPLFFIKKLSKNHAILYGTAILYCLVHGAIYVIFRYRLPIMPIMSILSVSGLNFAYLWWDSRKSPKFWSR